MKEVSKKLFCIIPMLFLLCACEPKIPPLDFNSTILAFGDDVTAGNGVADGKSYPEVLSTLTERKVINAGVVGEMTTEGLARLPALLVEHQPDMLIICHGGNDFQQNQSKADIEANIRRMIGLAQAREIPVLLLGSPDPSVFVVSVDFYKEVARDMGVVFLEDIVSDVLARPAMRSDEYHPNTTGYSVIATEVFDLLEDMKSI